MPYEHLDPYITDLDDYTGPVDRISPYHYYQYTYWGLRGIWRRRLYAWTRGVPCDASTTISPTQVIAGTRQTLTLTLTLGPTPLPTGGRIAVYCQKDFGGTAYANTARLFQGPDGQTGYGARVTAQASRPGVELRVQMHSTGAVFTCPEIIVEQGTLEPGDTVTILLGDPRCKPMIVCDKAKSLPFRVAIDFRGDRSFQRVDPHPTVQIVGNRALYLRCFAPTTPPPGEPFDVRVIAADMQNHNPSYFHQGELTLTAAEGTLSGTTHAAFDLEAHGSLAVEGVQVDTDQVTRIRVIDETNSLMGQTNPVCPAAAPTGLALFYGEIHSHTELSDGTGSTEDNFRWARNAEGLDFAALADHFEDGQSYNYTLEDKWRITKETTEAYNEPGRFITLLGYEIGTLEAHRNVYFCDGEGRMIVEGPAGEKVTMDNVYDKLAGTDYVLIPHAPKFHGINWDRPHDPDRQRLVEICSNWGISEEGGPLSVRHALDLGYQFGFTGGTDNHCAEPGNPRMGGITGVFATELTRPAVFMALKERLTFATSGPRMIIRFDVNGRFMGSAFSLESRERAQVQARAITTEPIQRLEIIRNGQVAHSLEPKDTADAALTWEDPETVDRVTLERPLTGTRFAYYYLRVTTVNQDFGWSSPVWIAPL